jgi:hypothetical protein
MRGHRLRLEMEKWGRNKELVEKNTGSIVAVMPKRSVPTLARGAFEPAITAEGRVDIKVLAKLLDLPLATLAPALGLSRRALDIDPTAAKAQTNARRFLTAMNELAANLTDKRFALFWLKTPYKTFGGRTAADWLKDGDLDGVCAAIDRLVVNQPE